MSLDEAGILYAGTQSHDDDKRLFVHFSVEPRLDRKATAEASDGMNHYKNVEFVTIKIPGDKTMSVHRPVVASDKQRFPLQYAAFRNSNTGEQIIGFPLTAWPGCKPNQAKELEYFNVRTVEQLAAMPDSAGGSGMMGIQALKQAAKAFIAARKEEAPLLKVQQELAARDNTIAALTDQLAKQGAILDRILAREEALSEKEPQSKKGK
jgi:hypothetical protein